MARNDPAVGVSVTETVVRCVATEPATLAPIAVSEVPRSGSLGDSIRGALHALRLRPGTVAMVIGLDRATVRRMSLPHTTPQNVDRMVRFEAERYIPLPLDAVELDYQVRPDRGADRLDVVVAAVRKDDATQAAQALAQATTAKTVLDTSGTALLAAWHQGWGETGDAVLISELSGAHASLVVCDAGNLILARSVPVGVEALRAALAEDLKISLVEAETVRRTQGVQGLEVGPPDLLPSSEPTDRETTTAWLTRLTQEIRRTLEAFRSQRGGMQRCRVVVTGEGADTPGLVQALGLAIGQSVDIFDPFARSAVALPGPGHHFTLAYGAALRSAGKSPVALDLSPRAELAVRRRRREKTAWAAALVALLITIGAAYSFADARLKRVESEARRVRDSVTRLRAEVGDVDMALSAAAAVQDVNQLLLEMQKPESRPLDILRDVSDSFPGGLWLKEFLYDRTRGVTIRGHSLDSIAITEAVRALSRRPYLQNVKLTGISIVAIGDRQVYEFQITAEFVEPDTSEGEAKGANSMRRASQ